jgi:hypothetical protein
VPRVDILELIDRLDDLVHNAKPVPLTDQVRVNKEEIYDLLDQMRGTLPAEIQEARNGGPASRHICHKPRGQSQLRSGS